jgi:hypothetical protein
LRHFRVASPEKKIGIKRWRTRQTHWLVSDTVASLTIRQQLQRWRLWADDKPTKINRRPPNISQCHSLLFPSASEAWDHEMKRATIQQTFPPPSAKLKLLALPVDGWWTEACACWPRAELTSADDHQFVQSGLWCHMFDSDDDHPARSNRQ